MSMDWMGEESGRSTSLSSATKMETEEGRNRIVSSRSTKVKDLLWDLGARGEQLIPGIPNEVTVGQISPKLPWRAFHTLSSVSRGWRKVIQSHLVYGARVRAQSTETLSVVNYIPSGRNIQISQLALYSVMDNFCYKLPAIPHLLEGLPCLCQCISLDGKIYILGGYGELGHASNEVYVLDLAGQREWTQCTAMLEPRTEFACGVMDGKIYVFGGIDCREPVCGSEMYNPETNAWSCIKPMGFMRFGHHVMASGEELFVYGGHCFHADYFEKKANGDYARMNPYSLPAHRASFLGVYHPARDEWRAVKKFERDPEDRVFSSEGKFYSMTRRGNIYVHDENIEKGSWLHLHSPGGVGATISKFRFGCPLLAVNGGLVALGVPDGAWKRCLCRSKGLGGEKKEMVWEEANGPLLFREMVSDRANCFMFPIQL